MGRSTWRTSTTRPKVSAEGEKERGREIESFIWNFPERGVKDGEKEDFIRNFRKWGD
jgi:hypothetical protein